MLAGGGERKKRKVCRICSLRSHVTAEEKVQFGCVVCFITVTYSAVAITADSEFIPFGPTFESEDKAWEWLHFECDLCPVHKEIKVYAIQPGNVISFWNN